MRRHLTSVRATVVALACGVAIVVTSLAPAGAQAASTPSPSAGLTGLASLLCPASTTVKSVISGPLNAVGLGSVGSAVTGAASTAACNLGALQVDYHSVYVTSSGATVTTDTTSVVGVPTPLNVDNGLLPDMSADITLTGSSLSTAQLQITRDSDSGTLPVEVEAVLSDPTGAVDGHDSFAVGYDATADNAPASFTLSTPLSALTDASDSYQFTLAQTDPGKTIAVVGSVFNGTISAPTDPESFRLDYGASPTSATITATPGADISATLDQNTTGPATLSAQTTSSSGATQNLSLAIDNLPSALTVGVNPSTGAVSWNASAAVSQVTATLTGSLPIAFGASTIQATLSSLPTSFTLAAQQTATGLSLTSTNPIGELDLDAASADESYPTVPAGQGGVVIDTTHGLALALRAYGLTSLAYTSSPVSLSTAMAAGHVFSVNADLAQTSSSGAVETPLTADLTVTDMPASLALALDSSTGEVSYTASGTVSSITGAIDGDQSLFLGADHLQFALAQVPTSFNLAASQSTSGVNLTSDNPIGEVQLFARSDGESYPTFTADQTGVDIDNTNGLSFGLQVFGLQKLAFSSDPISVSTELEAGHPFTVDANLAQTDANGNAESPLAANLTVTNMPATLALSIDPTGGAVTYSASDTVDSITGSVDAPQPLFLGGNHFQFALDQVPTSFNLDASQSASGVDLSSDNPIGEVQLFARSDNDAYPTFAAGQTGIDIDDTNGLSLGLQVFGLQKLDFSSSPVSVSTEMAPGYPFTVNANLAETDSDGNAESPLTANLTFTDMPAQLSLAVNPDSGAIDYSASDTVESLTGTVSSPQPILLGATSLQLSMQNVPTSVSVSSANGINLSAPGGIGSLALFAASANQQYPTIPGGGNGAYIDNTNGLQLGLQASGVSQITFSPSPLSLQTAMTGGSPFDVYANLGQTDSSGNPTTPITATADIDNMPADFSLGEGSDSSGGSELTLNDSDPIANLSLSVDGISLLPDANDIQVGMDQVPTQMTVDLPESGPVATISASAPIGQIQLAASNGSATLPADTYASSGDDELDFTDTASAFDLAVRLTAVKSASIALDPAININLTQDPTQTRPIDIDAQFPNSNGTTATVTGTPAISAPSASTGIAVNLGSSQTTLTLTNAAPLAEVNLKATNLGSIPSATITLTNIPTSLTTCLDTGPACERANPTELGGTDTESPARNGNSAGNNRPYPANVSLNFDDSGSSGTSTAISSMTTLNAAITPSAGATPINITNLRFHNLELDLGLPGSDFSFDGESVPYLYMYIDSRNDPFVMNGITYPPTVQNFEIGSDSDPATASNRILWLQGEKCETSVFGHCILYELQQASAGSLNCGNESVLEADDINLLDAFGLGIDLLDVCSSGGS